MRYLLDTNIAIHAGAANSAVLGKFSKYAGSIFLSALVLTELFRGLHKNRAFNTVRQAQLDVLLQQFPVIGFDAAAAEAYGRIIAQLGWVKGRDFDRMIAAHALSARATLITANEKDFQDVPGLRYENWLAA